MIFIYCDSSKEKFDSDYLDEELRRKAIQYSQTVAESYIRNRYVSMLSNLHMEFASYVISQHLLMILTEKPFLETYHII